MADRFRRSSLIGPIRFFQDIARQGLLLDYAFFFWNVFCFWIYWFWYTFKNYYIEVCYSNFFFLDLKFNLEMLNLFLLKLTFYIILQIHHLISFKKLKWHLSYSFRQLSTSSFFPPVPDKFTIRNVTKTEQQRLHSLRPDFTSIGTSAKFPWNSLLTRNLSH